MKVVQSMLRTACLGVAALVLSSGMAWGGVGPGARSMAVDFAAMGKTIDLPADTVLEVKLPAVPGTGYRWEVLETSMPGAAVRAVSLMANNAPEFEPVTFGFPGDERVQVVRMVGQRAGQTQVTLVYRRPWENAIEDSMSFTIRSAGAFRGRLPAPRAEAPAAEALATDQIMAPGLPARFDWRDQGMVTAVRNQGSCGSCWAFGAVAAFESKVMIKDGVVPNFSEQYLVSCNNDGFSCNGGWWAHPYHYNKYLSGEPGAGARNESDFPYYGYDYPCYPPHTARQKLDGWAYTDNVSDGAIPYYNHSPSTATIKQRIYDYGPVATVVCSATWGGYYGGVFYNHCSSGDHIVLITGWDDASGAFYIKNSWGTSWGESGYMRLAYGYNLVGYQSTYLKYKEGVTPTPTPPVANFTASPTTVQKGGTVRFTDTSTGSPTAWSWTFTGGTPSSSTAQNPSVVYNTAGTYSVTLRATNSAGSNTVTKSNFITVTDSTPPPPCTMYTGTLSGTGAYQYQPNGNWYRSSVSGTHTGILTGPSTADFDLELYKSTSSGWTRVASSAGSTSSERIDYNGTAGYYYWRVISYSGSGSYQLCLSVP